MKTVLHLIETGGIGGAETVYLNIVRRLDSTRWRSVAVVPHKGWLYNRLVESGIEPVVIAEGKSVNLGFLSRIYALLRKERVSIIHAHLLGSSVRAAALSAVTGIPAIGTLHGVGDVSPSERLRNLKTMILNRGLHRLVFVSESLRRSLAGSLRLRPGLAAVIPNGIDASRFVVAQQSAIRSELGITDDAFLVGTIGNPSPAKGLDVMLKAAALLKARSPGCRFVIVGELAHGRGAEVVQLRADLDLVREVVLTDYRSDVEQILGALDLYILSSRSEGFSLTLVEAMAAGLPIVATKCGGPEEILEDGVTGVLVANESPEAIANAVHQLRSNPSVRQQLGSAARAAVRQRYRVEDQITSYEQLYEACLALPRNRVRIDPSASHLAAKTRFSA